MAFTVGAGGCEPASATAATGTIDFVVTNATTARAEFEVVSDSPEVLAEEFLEAGKTATFPLTLAAGDYQLICGSPGSTRGSLTVTGVNAAGPTTTLVDQAALQQAVQRYTTFVLAEVEKLRTTTKQFTDAVRVGDTEAAKLLYAPTRVAWETIEPVAELFPDSDAVIDSRADDFPSTRLTPTSPVSTRLSTGCGRRARSTVQLSICLPLPPGWTATSPPLSPR